MCRGVGSLLVYVKSLKGLAAIRDAVWDLLSTESISQHWSTVCQRLLERPLAVWDDFLQQLFLQRLQVGVGLGVCHFVAMTGCRKKRLE